MFSGPIEKTKLLTAQDRAVLREMIWMWLHGTTDGQVALDAASSKDSALTSIEKLLDDGMLVASYDPKTEIFTIKPAGISIIPPGRTLQ